MSIQQLNKVFALEHRTSAGEFRLLCYLAQCADANGGRVFPGDRRLCAETGWSRRYLRLVRRRLEQRRWLVRVRNGNGRGHRAIYHLNLPSPTGEGEQLPLPFPLVQILLKPCGQSADEGTEKRIMRSAKGDHLIRGGEESPTTTAGDSTTSPPRRRADPSMIRPVLQERTEEEPRRAGARRLPRRA